MKQKRGFDLVVYLNDMCERIESDYHLEEHVSILNGYAKRRELMTLSDEIRADCNNQVDPSEVINKISDKVVDIQEMGDVVEFDLNLANKEVLASWDAKKDNASAVNETDFNQKTEYYNHNSCSAFCNTDTPTCTNRSSDAVKYNTRLSMCWDNLNNLKMNDAGLLTDGELYFMYGECSCGEYYISQVSIDTLPIVLTEPCRECKPEGK